MPEHVVQFQHIALATHPRLPEAQSEAEKIAAFLKARGVEVTCGNIYDETLVSRIAQHHFDLWVALGGDGSLLRSGHLCAPYGVPILGINMGNLGFLMEIHRDEWPRYLELLINGEYWIEARMMLRAEQYRGKELLGAWEIVNEAMVGRGEIMRPVRLTTAVDGQYLTTYVADGLIAATPTGSTAYAMAAGGPILPPELRNYLIIPVAAHLSFDRAIVLAEGSTVSIQVATDHTAALSVDGQHPVPLRDGDRVDIRAGQHTFQLVRFQDPGYYYRNLTSHMNRNITGDKA